MTQNEHVYAICRRPDVAGDAFSGENVKTIDGYVVLKFEVASFSRFRDIPKNHFLTVAEAAADFDDSIRRKGMRVSL